MRGKQGGTLRSWLQRGISRLASQHVPKNKMIPQREYQLQAEMMSFGVDQLMGQSLRQMHYDMMHAAETGTYTKEAREGAEVKYEESMLQDCAHPHVIECHGSNEDGSALNLEMASSDLYHHLMETEHGALEPKEVLSIAKSVGSALGFIHGAGFAHNDIKVCPH